MPYRSFKSPTALDAFCGVGGLSLGAMLAGFQVVGAVDSDQNVLDAFKKNFKNVSTTRRDLNDASGAELRTDLGLGKRRIDLLVGGPPCQGFSVGGIGAENDPRNEGVLS